MLPHFLVIGAQKSGTTSLYRYLGRHPESVRARHKELHYFDREFERGTEWYEGQLAAPWRVLARRLLGRRTLCGEATPCYLADPEVPARVRALLPDVRLVVLLRDPSRRAISHYHHRVRHQLESREAADALGDELARAEREGDAALPPLGYLARGHYARQLERWLAHYPRERFLVLPAEPFFADPAPTVRRVADFVGLAPRDPATYVGVFNVRHAGRYAGPAAALVTRLDAYFAPHNARLSALWPELGAPWAMPGEAARA